MDRCKHGMLGNCFDCANPRKAQPKLVGENPATARAQAASVDGAINAGDEWDQAQDQKLTAMRQAGATLSEIAAALGRTYRAVSTRSDTLTKGVAR